MKTNVKVVTPAPRTHGGNRAARISAKEQLRRSVLANFLFEGEFYEDGESNAARIAALVPKVPAVDVANLAIEARNEMYLRHVPLFLAVEMLKYDTHRPLVAALLPQIIKRADELSEILAIYWREGRKPIAAQLKRGLAASVYNFDEYQFAKYNRSKDAVKLRDVFRLVHPVPQTEDEAELFQRVVKGGLKTPDTWEVALSSGADKKEAWGRLLSENKLGASALLRNLRNMQQAKVTKTLIRESLNRANVSRELPFRFLAAAKHAPDFEPELEGMLTRSVANSPKLGGKTIFIIDMSGSMDCRLSAKSEMSRFDAAAALAVVGREMCEDAVFYATAGNDARRVHATMKVKPRRGFALAEQFTYDETYRKIGGGGIFLKQVMDYVRREEEDATRIIVFTDEQDCDSDDNAPERADAFGLVNYIVNVSSYDCGIAYTPKWTHINGWSYSVFNYMIQNEMMGQQ